MDDCIFPVMPHLVEAMSGSFEVRVQQGDELLCFVFDKELYGSSSEALEAAQIWCKERLKINNFN